MAIATPGNASATDRRLSANAPAAPLASATTRSPMRGAIRPWTWLLDSMSRMPGASHMKAAESPIAVATPMATSNSDRPMWRWSPVTMASAVAMMGVMRGATIMAPMTVAVESPSTPPVAMSTDSTSRTAKRMYASRPGSRSK